jgi:hypothetical protein
MMIVNEGPLLAQSGHWPRQEAIEIQGRTREASRSCGVAPFNRVFDGCARPDQHGCERSHIRIGAAVLIRG